VGTFVTNPIAICHPFANLHQEASAASLYGSRHPITIPLLNYILHQPINPAPAFTKYLYIRYKPAKSTKLKNKLLKAIPVTYHDRSLETKFQIAGSCPGLAKFPWFSTYWLHEHYVSGLHREKLEIEIDRRKIEIRVELVCPWRSWGYWSLIWNISAYQHPFFCSRWRKYWKKTYAYIEMSKKTHFFEESLTHVRWRPPKCMVLITDTTSFFHDHTSL